MSLKRHQVIEQQSSIVHLLSPALPEQKRHQHHRHLVFVDGRNKTAEALHRLERPVRAYVESIKWDSMSQFRDLKHQNLYNIFEYILYNRIEYIYCYE